MPAALLGAWTFVVFFISSCRLNPILRDGITLADALARYFIGFPGNYPLPMDYGYMLLTQPASKCSGWFNTIRIAWRFIGNIRDPGSIDPRPVIFFLEIC